MEGGVGRVQGRPRKGGGVRERERWPSRNSQSPRGPYALPPPPPIHVGLVHLVAITLLEGGEE